MDLLTLTYREYSTKLMQKVFHRVPYMRGREIAIVLDLLRHVRPQMCLEWGSGYSTAYFPRFLSNHARWVAIEHVP
jgi:hypothetical protein